MKSLFHFAAACALLLVFLALFVPTTYFEVKAIILLLCLFSILILSMNGSLRWTRETLVACLLISVIGLFNSFNGLLNGNPGALPVLTVLAAWPILYGIISALMNNSQAMVYLSRAFLLALLMITLYSLLYLGSMAGIVPGWAYLELDQGQAIGFHDGYVEFRLFSISSLLFLVPYALHFVWNQPRRARFSPYLWILVIAALVLALLTGRRAVLLVLLLSPILILFSQIVLGVNSKKLQPRRIIFIALTAFAAVSYLLSQTEIRMDAVWNMFAEGFNFEHGDESATERTRQFYSLMQGWINGNILFGAGNGAVADVIRSYKFPWAYELTYIYLLFSVGLVGVVFYVVWFGWGLLRLRNKLLARPELAKYVAPMVTGVFGMAIGGATNPYFFKFDYLWIIMLPHLLAGCLKYQVVNNR